MLFALENWENALDAAADTLVLGEFEDGDFSAPAVKVDAALDGALAAARQRQEFKGKIGETFTVFTLGRLASQRVVLLGLGKRSLFSAETVRRAAGAAYRAIEKAAIKDVWIGLNGDTRVTQSEAVRACVEGMALRSYRFDHYFTTPRPPAVLESVTLLVEAEANLEAAVSCGEAMAAGANYARDLANEPPNVLYPQVLAQRARELADQFNFEVEVFEPEELSQRGMTALLAVGQGSERPPCLIVIRYHGATKSGSTTLGLVGKGITFDTGGISLKPGPDMHLMKTDMGGAAAMFGAMHIIGTLRPALDVTMIVASAENMPDGKAFRPGDIIRAKNGKSIEIQNTDAEGRLVLADALSYAVELGLSPIIDAATLTGACSVALGPFYSACFSSVRTLGDALCSAGNTAGERLWQMPLDTDYRPLLDSSCADLRNVGGREGGAIIAAVFLQEFVGSQPWAHLDIAPTAFADTEGAYFAKGLATGHPARTLAQFALDAAGS